MKGSLFTLLVFAILFGWLQLFGSATYLQNPVFSIVIGIAYMWIPGIVALIWSKRQKLDFPIFAKSKAFLWVPLLCFFFSLVAFLFSLLFREIGINPVFVDKSVGMLIFIGILMFVLVFCVLSFLFSFVFLGGELFWRGFLWEKLKGNGPGKAMVLTGLLWALWQIPTTTLSPYVNLPSFFINLAITLVLSFALTPLLTFFRIKGRSVFAAALGFSSLLASWVLFLVLFPSVDPRIGTLEFGLCLLVVLLIAYFPMKIFQPKTWQ